MLKVGTIHSSGAIGNYALLATSPFHGNATDGKDPGADIAGLTLRLAGRR